MFVPQEITHVKLSFDRTHIQDFIDLLKSLKRITTGNAFTSDIIEMVTHLGCG